MKDGRDYGFPTYVYRGKVGRSLKACLAKVVRPCLINSIDLLQRKIRQGKNENARVYNESTAVLLVSLMRLYEVAET